jgi:hypothetical protein
MVGIWNRVDPLLPALLQYVLAITRLRQNFVEGGIFPQILQQRIIQQGSIGTVILLYRSLQ